MLNITLQASCKFKFTSFRRYKWSSKSLYGRFFFYYLLSHGKRICINKQIIFILLRFLVKLE